MNGLTEVPVQDFGSENYESDLEDLLVRSPSLLDGEMLLFIGRQVPADFGIIDLLAINEDGVLFVLELKRGKTPRDVIAQSLSYASWVAKLSYNDIEEIARKYFEKTGREFSSLAAVLKESFAPEQSEYEAPEDINSKQVTCIIGQEIDDEVASVARYLREFDIDICCLEFTYHATEGTDEIFNTEWIVAREEDEKETRQSEKKGPGKYDQFLKTVVAKIVEGLPEELNPSKISQHDRKNYKQIYYPGFGYRHFEIRYLRGQKAIEIAIHNEPSRKAEDILKNIFTENEAEIKKILGENVKWEPWGTKWDRIYMMVPITQEELLGVDQKKVKKVSDEAKKFIGVIQPLLTNKLKVSN